MVASCCLQNATGSKTISRIFQALVWFRRIWLKRRLSSQKDLSQDKKNKTTQCERYVDRYDEGLVLIGVCYDSNVMNWSLFLKCKLMLMMFDDRMDASFVVVLIIIV